MTIIVSKSSIDKVVVSLTIFVIVYFIASHPFDEVMKTFFIFSWRREYVFFYMLVYLFLLLINIVIFVKDIKIFRDLIFVISSVLEFVIYAKLFIFIVGSISMSVIGVLWPNWFITIVILFQLAMQKYNSGMGKKELVLSYIVLITSSLLLSILYINKLSQ